MVIDSGSAPPDRRSSILGRTVLQFGGQVAFGALLLLNGILVSGWLGPADKGRFALLVFVPFFTVFLVNLGFGSGISYFASRREIGFATAAGSTIAFGLTVGGALVAVGGAAMPAVERWIYTGVTRFEIAVSGLALPPLLAMYCFEPLWVAADRTRSGVVVRLIHGSAYLAAAVGLVGMARLGTRGAIIAYSTAAWIALLALVTVAWLHDRALRASVQTIGKALRFAASSHPGAMAEYILYRGDTYLMSRLTTFTALGYYSFAQPFAEIIWLLSMSVRPVIFAETSRAGTASGWELTARGVRLTLTASVVLALTIFAGAWVLVTFLLPSFVPSIPVLAILLTATTSATVFQLLVGDLISRGEARRASRVSLITFVPALIAYLVLIPRMGAIGAALASLFAYGLQSALAIILYRRVTGSPIGAFFLPTREDLRILSTRARGLLGGAAR